MLDIFIDSRGYYRFRDSRRLVHRWAAEKKLGRKLRQGEVVHHVNHNKLDNRPSNLYICSSQEEHLTNPAAVKNFAGSYFKAVSITSKF